MSKVILAVVKGVKIMQYEVRTMPDGLYIVVDAEGKKVTQHYTFDDAQRVSDHMNRKLEHEQNKSLLYSSKLKSE
jgi:hypothetical protein